MKKNLPITDKEHSFSAEEQIISTTDLKGAVTQANDVFVNISGFTMEEILGKNHNLVRHPDMPPAAFEDLWTHIKAGQTWAGIVKNRCKNGDYYWVDAYVTPVFENGQIVGYQSVRIKPEQDSVRRADKLYQRINAGKGLGGWLSKMKPANMKFATKTLLASLFAMLPVVTAVMNDFAGWVNLSAIAVSVVFAVVLSVALTRPVRNAAAKARDIFDNPIAQAVYTGRGDEIGQLLMTLHANKLEQNTMLTRIADTTAHLNNIAAKTQQAVSDTNSSSHQQQRELDLVATAIEEMTATVREVAMNTQSTSDETKNGEAQAEAGTQTSVNALNVINELASNVENASNVIKQLEAKSSDIGSVINVINDIAEQTNLLALNAAIEAARAGEQGRGFAVVADEVRSLASRTQQSTVEIRHMVEELQNGTNDAVNVMHKVSEAGNKGSAEVSATVASLESITHAVQKINGMSVQIATAAEEQSAVTEEISRNVNNIMDISNHTVVASDDTTEATEALIVEVNKLKDMVRQFKVI